MKKLLLVFTILLSGCSTINSENIEYNKRLKIDSMTELAFVEKYLETYTYVDKGYLYVELDNYLDVFSLHIEDYELEYSDGVVRITTRYDYNLIQKIGMQRSGEDHTMTLDTKENSIHYTDIEYLEAISGRDIYDVHRLSVTSYHETETIPFEIEFNDYEIDFIEEDGKVYIPLHVANYFVAGTHLNMIPSDDKLYIFDTGRRNIDFDQELWDDFNINIEEYQSFLALYLNTLHGLKEYNNYGDFNEIVEQYKFDRRSDIRSLHKGLHMLIDDLVDLHTGVRWGGPRNPSTTFARQGSLYSNEKLKNYVYTSRLCNVEEDYSLNIKDGVAVISINTFLFDVNPHHEFYEMIKEAYESDVVVLDLSCNSGGSLHLAEYVLALLTDDEVTVIVKDQLADSITEVSYVPITKEFESNKPLYVIISNKTYSAGNFVASMIQDNGWGTLVGEKTSGGACIVDFVTNVDSSVMGISSHLCLMDSSYTLIEDGVEPDIEFEVQEYIKGYTDIFEYINSIHS